MGDMDVDGGAGGPGGRLTVDELDPRSLYPTLENLERVNSTIELVEQQLEQDSAAMQSDKSAAARQAHRETLEYLQLLNDWAEQARVMAQAQQGRQAQQPRESPYPVSSRQRVQVNVSSGQQTSAVPSAAAGASQQQQRHQPQLERTIMVGADGAQEALPLRMSDAQEGNWPVRVNNTVQMRKCVFDVAHNKVYVFIKKIRKTIYGAVNAYQEGYFNERQEVNLNPVQVAGKVYKKELVTKRVSQEGHRVQEDPLKELAIQQRLSIPGHQFVMPLLRCLVSTKHYYAIFPLVQGGELFDTVARDAPMPEHVARSILRCGIEAVSFCHRAGVCHRDVSLENFLLGKFAAAPSVCKVGGWVGGVGWVGEGHEPRPHNKANSMSLTLSLPKLLTRTQVAQTTTHHSSLTLGFPWSFT